MYHTMGAKYEETQGMESSALVKLIKDDIRAQLPKAYKVLAQKQLYAGGWSIHFQIKNTGIDKYKQEDKMAYHDLELQVIRIVNQYNFNDNDLMSDYHHVRFYAHIRIEK